MGAQAFLEGLSLRAWPWCSECPLPAPPQGASLWHIGDLPERGDQSLRDGTWLHPGWGPHPGELPGPPFTSPSREHKFPCPGLAVRGKSVRIQVGLTDSTARQTWRRPDSTLGWQEGTSLQGKGRLDQARVGTPLVCNQVRGPRLSTLGPHLPPPSTLCSLQHKRA